ncbi:E3 ubiquitin-protein ligase KEG-like [Senna tora]|uniref:E3 ubiquitin-protein ligase KEG-like n=1 Tax=Senna tora TaxID=362788 RepID=A0A834WP37_9FABA|nr:E3 ubiquitin-protein ligase KEG-like [Senna tora]
MVTSFSLATRSKFPKNPYALRYNLSFHSHNFSGDDHHFEAFIKSSPGPSIVVINKHLADLVDHKRYSDVISRWKVVRGYGIIGCNFSTYGFEPTVVTWTTLLRGLCDHHQIGKAFEFYREAKKNGLELNRISCSTLIQGLCKSGLKLRLELRCSRALYPFSRNCVWNFVSLNVASVSQVRVFTRRKRSKKAVEVQEKEQVNQTLEQEDDEGDNAFHKAAKTARMKLENLDWLIVMLRNPEADVEVRNHRQVEANALTHFSSD